MPSCARINVFFFGYYQIDIFCGFIDSRVFMQTIVHDIQECLILKYLFQLFYNIIKSGSENEANFHTESAHLGI